MNNNSLSSQIDLGQEIIEIDDDDEDPGISSIAENEQPGLKKKNWMPVFNGYTKPSYSFPQMITQALAVCTDRKATALKICELIAGKHPFYKYHTGNWQKSVYYCLTKRKKFFLITDTNDDGEYVWSFNPTFEKYMLDKWMPKQQLIKKKQVSSSVSTSVLLSPKCSSTSMTQKMLEDFVSKPTYSKQGIEMQREGSLSSQFNELDSGQSGLNFIGTMNIVASASENKTSHVALTDSNRSGLEHTNEPQHQSIVSSTTENNTEFAFADPMCLVERDDSEEIGANLWEPEIKVLEISTAPFGNNLDEFAVGNMHQPHITLSSYEIKYRLQFQKAHPAIQKFRLHCTICDMHLGTSGLMAKNNVRFHASLGVLTCLKCYNMTKSALQKSSNSCQWCNKIEGNKFFCYSCSSTFCEDCIKRNFGLLWWSRMSQKKDWQCFICDKKQIWPHRAVAYFLLCHYSELKKMKNRLTNGFKTTLDAELPYFLKDHSTCCQKVSSFQTNNQQSYSLNKPSTIVCPTGFPSQINPPNNHFNSQDPLPLNSPLFAMPPQQLSETLTPTNKEKNLSSLFPTDQRESLIFNNQPPNRILVQNTCFPSLTVNTGTQYIHNAYPDTNRLIVQPLHENIKESGISSVTSCHKESLANFMVGNMQSTYTSSKLANMEQHSKNLFSQSPNAIRATPGLVTKVDKVVKSDSSSDNMITTCQKTATNFESDPDCITILDDETPHNTVNLNFSASSRKITMREEIERRPMPKSKKEKLLRTMNESIQFMKNHLQSSSSSSSKAFSEDPNSEKLKEGEELSVSVATKSSDLNTNVEEPILKSIIQTAAERLLKLRENQNNSHSLDNDKKETLTSNSRNSIRVQKVFPKIKVKTLEELQGDKNVTKREEKLTSDDKKQSESTFDVRNSCDAVEVPHSELNIELKEIDVTGLKQGIIDASRTLITTQKKFKELAKVISKNLTFRTEKTSELVTLFQNIVRLCQKQIDTVGKNVERQYGNLTIHDNKVPKISETCENTLHKKVSKTKSDVLYQNPINKVPNKIVYARKEPTNSYHTSTISCANKSTIDKDSPSSISENENDNVQGESSLERNRDLVDFNPLGKKIILGSPEITQEDLEQIVFPNIEKQGEGESTLEPESYRQKLYLKNTKKRRDIWSYKSRKKSNNKGMLKRRVGKSYGNLKWTENEDRRSFLPRPQSKYIEERLRRRLKKVCRPLRSSERNHASSAELVARTFSALKRPSSSVNYNVKPCSVFVNRLDPRIVDLLEKKINTA